MQVHLLDSGAAGESFTSPGLSFLCFLNFFPFSLFEPLCGFLLSGSSHSLGHFPCCWHECAGLKDFLFRALSAEWSCLGWHEEHLPFPAGSFLLSLKKQGGSDRLAGRERGQPSCLVGGGDGTDAQHLAFAFHSKGTAQEWAPAVPSAEPGLSLPSCSPGQGQCPAGSPCAAPARGGCRLQGAGSFAPWSRSSVF